MIPEIAIIGHPNEGKSSVLSTLAEDDSVRISPFPGETTRCRVFPIVIDDREVLRFTDTPGFQNPARLLDALASSPSGAGERIRMLLELTTGDPQFAEDHELLKPLARGAGIIYVVDGSRPLRQIDRAEMDVLRLLGRPRMAVLNCKDEQQRFLQQWKDELGQHFNSWRLFNAHRATYAERIELFDALKSIDQDWQPVLADVVRAFTEDWRHRTEQTAEIISQLLVDAVGLQMHTACSESDDESALRNNLLGQYTRSVASLERAAQQRIRGLFKHNIFDYRLPPHSIIHEDLASERSWQLLGLSTRQLLVLGSFGGAAVGAGVEAAALGHGLGLFTAIGAAAGAAGALVGRRHMKTTATLLGMRLAGTTLQIGPAKDISLLFVLINRQLLFFRHVINWAHGRRDYQEGEADASRQAVSYTQDWAASELRACHSFFRALLRYGAQIDRDETEPMRELLVKTLMKISNE